MEEEKHKVGRPLKFANSEDMQTKIDAYFEDCNKNQIPYTITGLSLALDCDRVTLLNYSKKEEFFSTIKRAKLMVEHALELMLLQSSHAGGTIFNLKNNFGWKDKQEVDVKAEVKISTISKEDAEIVKDTFDKIME